MNKTTNDSLPQTGIKCDEDCQYLYTTAVFWFSFACTILSIAVTAFVLKRQATAAIEPPLKYRSIGFLVYMPVMLSVYTYNLYLEANDISSIISSILEVLRRLLQIFAFYSFWKMTESHVSEDRVKDLLQRKVYGHHFRPFRYCISPYNFLTEEFYKKSMRRFRRNIYQSIFFQILPILAYILLEIHPNLPLKARGIKLTSEQVSQIVKISLLGEIVSLVVASYYILLYTRILKQEYESTHWTWKYLIYLILVILSNLQWIVLRSSQSNLLEKIFDMKQASASSELLLLTTNAILVAPETLLGTIISIFAFNPIPFEADPRFKHTSKSDMSFTTGRAHHRSYDHIDQDSSEMEISFQY